VAYRLGELTVHDPEAGALTLQGDGFAAAGEIATLLVSPGVQRFLQMSPVEAERAADLVARYREALTQLYRDDRWKPSHVDPAAGPARQMLWSDVRTLLGSERAERLKRLSWRVLDGDALVDEDLADALHLTPAQRRAIVETAVGNEVDHQRVLTEIQAMRLRDKNQLAERGRQANQAGNERLKALLTPEQGQQFEALTRGNP
jgi:hypothetical protein